MAIPTASPDQRLDRSIRRLGCLVRLDTARRAAELRRRSTATELEVLVRRLEHRTPAAGR